MLSLSSAMQSAVLLLLLPAALGALCPCPPSSEDSSVCGSDGRTYASECELQCAGLPGLGAAHPGPCAPPEPEVTAGRHRRYAVDYPEWNECFNKRKCAKPYWGNCSECGGGGSWSKCREMCSWNCACDCAKLPTSGLDKDSRDLFETCTNERECTERGRDACSRQYNSQLCQMDYVRCSCSCIQHALASWTNTTTAPASSTTPPATGSSTVPATSSGSTSTSSTETPPPGPAPGVTTATDQRADQPAAATAPVYVLWDTGVVLVFACVCVCACVLARWRTSVVCCPLRGDQRLTALCQVGPPPAAGRLPNKETNRNDVELNAYAQHSD